MRLVGHGPQGVDEGTTYDGFQFSAAVGSLSSLAPVEDTLPSSEQDAWLNLSHWWPQAVRQCIAELALPTDPRQ